MRLPIGADLLADIRRQGYRPANPVFVFIDSSRCRTILCSDMPIEVEIIIRPSDDVADLDFWPVRDLFVNLHGLAEMNNRVRAVLRELVRSGARHIMGCVPAERLIFAWRPALGWEFDHVA
jgi:hypothetical protein